MIDTMINPDISRIYSKGDLHGQTPQTKKESKKAHRRQNARWLVTITSVLILLLAGWLWYESLEEDNDLAAIGQGENVVVQVHDPG